jgi:hypothetical protein
LGLLGLEGLFGFVRIDGWRAECGLLGFGLVGWLGWVLVGRRRSGFKGMLEQSGLVVEETEAVGVAGGERDQMFFGEVVVVVESGSDPTRGILLSDFAGSDGSFDA